MKSRPGIFILFFYFLFTYADAQENAVKPHSASTDSVPSNQKFYALYNLSTYYYRTGNSDSMLYYSKDLLKTAQALNNDSFLVVSYRITGNCFYLKNDHVSAIKYYSDGIKIAEERSKAYTQLPQLYNNIGFNYNKLGYFQFALKYLKKAEIIALKNIGKVSSLAYIYENLSETFLGLNEPDSALKYLKLADSANLRSKEKYIEASILIDYGMTYAKLFYRDLSPKYLPQAENFFNRAIKFSNSENDSKHAANAINEYALFFFEQFRLDTLNNRPKLDSAKNYAEMSLSISTRFKYTDNIIKNADLLQGIYDARGNLPEAHRYLRLKIEKSDSLRKLNEENQLLNLTFDQEFREKEMEAKAKEAAEQRNRYIEISLIAIILITLVILFLLLSRSFVVNKRFIIFFGEVGLLIVFEFANLVLHPFIEGLTRHSVIFMLLILVFIAAVLIPIHHRLEKYVRIKLVEKNKCIRESAAKKILEEVKEK